MKINAKGTEISVITQQNDNNDYISLTDIAKYKNTNYPSEVIQNWMRSRSTVTFLGLWERLNNPNFNYLEFEVIDGEAGHNSFVLTPKRWINSVNAIGMTSKQGRFAATYAHSDIAFEFASWISPEFKLYIIKDYQRLKQDEARRLEIGWDIKREISKINYKIHTDAIKCFLITPELSKADICYTYSTETDILNKALFGKTAKEWREETGNKKQNMRDFATVEQLVVLINLESMNADLIRQNLTLPERLVELRRIAYYQLEALSGQNIAQRLSKGQTSALLEQ